MGAITKNLLEGAVKEVLSPSQQEAFGTALASVRYREVQGLQVCTLEQVKSALAGNVNFTPETFQALVKATGRLFTYEDTAAMQEANHQMRLENLGRASQQAETAKPTDDVATNCYPSQPQYSHSSHEPDSGQATPSSLLAQMGAVARGVLQSLRQRV